MLVLRQRAKRLFERLDLQTVKRFMDRVRLSSAALDVLRQDKSGVLYPDPGAARVIAEGMEWLGRAQDRSATHDSGVASHYSLLNGWAASYPETTGAIASTTIFYGLKTRNSAAILRARRMLDWLVSTQLSDGGFQGGLIDQKPRVPVTFNTGQVLIGLCSGAHVDQRYLKPLRQTADWLVKTQDADGCWRKYPTPFARFGVKTYETQVAMALFRAAAIEPGRGYAEAGLKQIEWALTQQRSNGWLANCCLTDPKRPLTHTLGYALRGIVSAYRHLNDERFLRAACRTADGLMSALDVDGRLPGRLDANWRRAVPWFCLTGISQVAESWLLLYKATGRAAYRTAALRANAFVRRTIRVDSPDDLRGGVKGSFPVDGFYAGWQYPSWACKFTIDANFAELAIYETDVARSNLSSSNAATATR